MNKRHQYILGLTYFGQHDSCAALIKNGQLIAASEEERFSRIKYDRSFPSQSIKFCLNQAGITINKIDQVGFFWQPWRGVGTRIFKAFRGLPESWNRGGKNAGILFDLLLAEKIFRQKTGYKGPFHFLDHHLTHAASTFFSSDFEKSAILSIDGTGETTTCWLGQADNKKFTNYKTTKWPDSLGHFYSMVTQYLGFEVFGGEYKTMGLSSYGKPEYLDEFRKIIRTDDSGGFKIDLDYTDYQYFKKRWYSYKWIRKFGPSRLPEENLAERHQNIASSLQARLEEVILELASYTLNLSGLEYLCLTGGVALNSLAVGKLAQRHIAKQIYTNPVSGDSGCALGSAYYINHIMLGKQERHPLVHAYWGASYSNHEIEKILQKYGLKYSTLEDPAQEAARLISQGQIIGWFQGRSELGQRALGNRSILADPRNASIKDKINSKIKNREPFRPFAPAILKEYQAEYFDCQHSVPFMTEVHPIKKEKQNMIPAVTHVDGTGRFQTVSQETNPLFWELINEFRKITGMPLVLNTSFNLNGQPIVDSPYDAADTFLKTGLDNLIIGRFLVKKVS